MGNSLEMIRVNDGTMMFNLLSNWNRWCAQWM